MSKQPFSQPLVLEYYSTMQVPLNATPSFTYPSLNAIPREDKIVVRFSSVRPVTSYPMDVEDVWYIMILIIDLLSLFYIFLSGMVIGVMVGLIIFYFLYIFVHKEDW